MTPFKVLKRNFSNFFSIIAIIVSIISCCNSQSVNRPYVTVTPIHNVGNNDNTIQKFLVSDINNKAYDFSVSIVPYIKIVYYNISENSLKLMIIPIYKNNDFDTNYKVIDLVKTDDISSQSFYIKRYENYYKVIENLNAYKNYYVEQFSYKGNEDILCYLTIEFYIEINYLDAYKHKFKKNYKCSFGDKIFTKILTCNNINNSFYNYFTAKDFITSCINYISLLTLADKDYNNNFIYLINDEDILYHNLINFSKYTLPYILDINTDLSKIIKDIYSKNLYYYYNKKWENINN